ncbi:MAG: deoxyguanosinetriphosphate triphosphohydrolase [Firmicutes bacterium]|nr:deoxyguanosinetriphosphate triphosphohydrolase [Bacillota bacterium]
MHRVREEIEAREAQILSPFAVLSRNSIGRQEQEEQCMVRTVFQRDRDRIIHSKAFRRLKHKTQVFIAPEGDHFRTRITHTLEVAQISRTVARALSLNEDLVEAIALGHDLGHTPFGHGGEEVLNAIYHQGFHHSEQSLRVVDHLEVTERRRGLNLTGEVRDGILHHTGEGVPFTLEGQIVKICDRIAYINHDIDDAVRAGIIRRVDLPQEAIDRLGDLHRSRINTMVLDLIENSMDKPLIEMSDGVYQAMDQLRNFLFEYVYLGEGARREEKKVREIITSLYGCLRERPEDIPEDFKSGMENSDPERTVVDYIAGMTDRYAVKVYEKYFSRSPW